MHYFFQLLMIYVKSNHKIQMSLPQELSWSHEVFVDTTIIDVPDAVRWFSLKAMFDLLFKAWL